MLGNIFVCLFSLLFIISVTKRIFGNAQNAKELKFRANWTQLNEHDEEIYFDFNTKVVGVAKTQKICAEKNAINMVLWRRIVIRGVNEAFQRFSQFHQLRK